MKRREFFAAMAAGLGSLTPVSRLLAHQSANVEHKRVPAGTTLALSSGNGLRATERAMQRMRNGADALDAVIEGVNIVENDPDDISVGYGGLPNEDGIVELDSCCMHGPTHNAGAVGALQHIKNPSKVARLVMERTDHVLLVGRGALEFAKAHGFSEENLLTDKARRIWLKYKESLSDNDDWFPPDEAKEMSENGFLQWNPHKRITGTITCMGMDMNGDISGVTTTSGLFYKIPGRVGDSPIVGAGLYVDNEVGACGSTGRGEENLKNLTCFLAVENMRRGLSPGEACLESCKRIVAHAKIHSILNDKGKPDFNVTFYAMNKDGEYGCASIYGPVHYAVHDGRQNVRKQGVYLYPNP